MKNSKTTFVFMLMGVCACMIVLCVYSIVSDTHKIKNKSKNTTIIATSQHGAIDTFKVNACQIWLREGDLIFQNDTDECHGNYHVIASGVYKFRTEIK